MSSSDLLRALILGLLLANTMLLIEVAAPRGRRCEPVRLELSTDRRPPPAASDLRVVDIRRAALPSVSLRQVLGLGPADRIVSVDDQPVTSWLDALARIEQRDTDYIDLGVRRRGRPARAVVLLHD